MVDSNGLCPTCGQSFPGSAYDDEISTYIVDKNCNPNNWVEDNLKLHNDPLEQINLKLNRIHTDVLELGISEELVTDLKNIMTKLQPRHGLCIDANCAPCRVQEEAIKEHVLLYVDWKVPGTVAKLEQARHRN